MTQATATKIDYSIPAMRIWEKLPEDVRAEVICGEIYILPPPLLYHQDIAGELFFELMLHAKTTGVGNAYMQRTGVFLNEGSTAVEPDVVFRIKSNSTCIVDWKGLFGPPDLLIEVLSTNKKRDLVTKKDLYEQTGVREYWIINPETKDAFGYLLQNNTYDEPLVLNSKINVRVLDKEISF